MLTPAQARAALVAWRASGLSVRAYCRTRGWNPERLRYWQRQFQVSASVPRGFVEMRPDGGGAVIEIRMANGACIPVRQGFDPGLLRSVVEALT